MTPYFTRIAPALAALRLVLPAGVGLRLEKASRQLSLFGDDKDVQAPGSKGGKFYRTESNKVRYGEKPAPGHNRDGTLAASTPKYGEERPAMAGAHVATTAHGWEGIRGDGSYTHPKRKGEQIRMGARVWAGAPDDLWEHVRHSGPGSHSPIASGRGVDSLRKHLRNTHGGEPGAQREWRDPELKKLYDGLPPSRSMQGDEETAERAYAAHIRREDREYEAKRGGSKGNPAEEFERQRGRKPTFEELHGGAGGLAERAAAHGAMRSVITDVTPPGYGPSSSEGKPKSPYMAAKQPPAEGFETPPRGQPSSEAFPKDDGRDHYSEGLKHGRAGTPDADAADRGPKGMQDYLRGWREGKDNRRSAGLLPKKKGAGKKATPASILASNPYSTGIGSTQSGKSIPHPNDLDTYARNGVHRMPTEGSYREGGRFEKWTAADHEDAAKLHDDLAMPRQGKSPTDLLVHSNLANHHSKQARRLADEEERASMKQRERDNPKLRGLGAELDTRDKMAAIESGKIEPGATVYARVPGDGGAHQIVKILSVDGDSVRVATTDPRDKREEHTIRRENIHQPGRPGRSAAAGGGESPTTAAARHAKTCGKCGHPILDAEGNPGYFGEACGEGLKLLTRHLDATGEGGIVPAWVREHVGKKGGK